MQPQGMPLCLFEYGCVCVFVYADELKCTHVEMRK